ncbi:MAG TPA: adenosine deaminase [Elusimicrobiota bacterium]|nr:adenosine deaminase [Elusimicrobiota bacterium]
MTDIVQNAENEVLKKLPKVDLHLHLDGAARPETLMDLMRASGASLPTEDPREFQKYVQVPRSCRSLADFLKAFEFFYPFLKSPEAVERLAYELCEDCSRLNVHCFEARFAPALQAKARLSQEDILRAALRGVERGARDFSVKAGLILCCYRSIPQTENDETVELAEKYLGRGVVGIDLAGDESRYPVSLYAACFKRAVERHIPITCHAGEADGPKSIDNALHLGARRIGHGVRLQEDSGVFERVKRERVPLEMCITSNVQTQAVKGFAVHPAKRYLEAGLCVTLNTDDPGVSGIDLVHEYAVAMGKLNFTERDLVRVILNGVDSLFLPEPEKKELRRRYEKELASLLKLPTGERL